MVCVCGEDVKDFNGNFECEGISYCVACGEEEGGGQSRISFKSEIRSYSGGGRSATVSRNSMNHGGGSGLRSSAKDQFYSALAPLALDTMQKELIYHLFTAAVGGKVTRRDRRKAYIVAAVHYSFSLRKKMRSTDYIKTALGYTLDGETLSQSKVSSAMQAVGLMLARRGKQADERKTLETISGHSFAIENMSSLSQVPHIAQDIFSRAEMGQDVDRVVSLYNTIKEMDLVLSRMRPVNVISALVYMVHHANANANARARGGKKVATATYSRMVGVSENTLKSTIKKISALDIL